MKKRPSHRVSRRFSGECCAKNTQTGAAQKCTRNTDARTNVNCDLSAPYLGIYRHNFRDNFASLRLWVALIALVSLSRDGTADNAMVNCQGRESRRIVELIRELDSDWRRRRDSNPRYAFGAYNGLANRRLQPLGHVSVCEKAYRIRHARSNHGFGSRHAR